MLKISTFEKMQKIWVFILRTFSRGEKSLIGKHHDTKNHY